MPSIEGGGVEKNFSYFKFFVKNHRKCYSGHYLKKV